MMEENQENTPKNTSQNAPFSQESTPKSNSQNAPFSQESKEETTKQEEKSFEANEQTKEKVQEETNKKEETLSLLQKENEALKKREEETKEFLQFFPNTNPYALPQEVLQLAKKGNSLSCAYAFYLLKKGEKEREAKEVNKQNNSFSLGNFQAKGNPFLTEEEVKKMTKEEVKKNFEVILASMKNWN